MTKYKVFRKAEASCILIATVRSCHHTKNIQRRRWGINICNNNEVASCKKKYTKVETRGYNYSQGSDLMKKYMELEIKKMFSYSKNEVA
jgi:hypothetical protein